MAEISADLFVIQRSAPECQVVNVVGLHLALPLYLIGTQDFTHVIPWSIRVSVSLLQIYIIILNARGEAG